MSTNWGLVAGIRRWVRSNPSQNEPKIGLALGGGFARGIAHLGVLRVLEQHNIPVHLIAGVSAGAIVASAYASGRTVEEIAAAARVMKFKDIARWTVSLLGFAESERMLDFLGRLLKTARFEEMPLPLAVVATNLNTGKPVVFRDRGDVMLPVRASCSYPGLFRPVRHNGDLLVDGAMSMEVPAPVLRRMGATHVISVCLPVDGTGFNPQNMFQVVNRCFQIMQTRTEHEWRRSSSMVLQPDVNGMPWDSFGDAERLIERGEKAALRAIPRILSWLGEQQPASELRVA